MTRGLKTVWYRRGLLNPFKYGIYSLMVFSHKLCRWLVPVALLIGAVMVFALALQDVRAVPVALLALIALVFAAAGWMWPEGRRAPKVFTIPAFVLVANLAALNGWLNLLRGTGSAAWAPTRRESSPAVR